MGWYCMDKYVEEGPIKNDSSAKLKNRKEKSGGYKSNGSVLNKL